MKRQLLTLVIACATLGASSQVLVNEDFSTATGTTPPAGWNNNDINASTELWSFDNPGGRTLNAPISDPAAIFDSDNYGAGGAEDCALETPAFDASTVTGAITLEFDHYFNDGFGGAWAVEVFDGTAWTQIAGGTGAVADPTHELIDITTAANGAANAQVRFRWTGDYSWYWIVDNVLIQGVSCAQPTAGMASVITDITANLGWTEAGSATQWEVEWGANGFTQGMGTLAIANANPHPATGLTAQTDYDYYVRAICGAGDTSAWSGPYTFTTTCPIAVPAYNEDFTNFTPNCWDVAGDGDPTSGPTGLGTSDWGGTNFLNGPVGDGGAKINLFSDTDQEWLLSPVFDFSQGGPYEVRVEAGVTDWNGTIPATMGSDDMVQLLISDDGGATWTLLHTWREANNPGNIPGAFTNVDLTAYTGSDVRFAIWATDGATDDSEDYDFHIGHFEVRDLPNCPEPSNLMASNITDGSANLSWTENGTATSWWVEYDTTGFTPGAGMGMVASASPFNVTGLNPQTDYDFYVRAICGAGDTSAWVGPSSFTTNCIAASIPWTEGFEGQANGDIPTCMAATGDFQTLIGTGTNNRGPRTDSTSAYTNWSADDWMFTEGVNLMAGTSYDFAAWYNTDGLSGWDELAVWVGTDQNGAGMTDSLTSLFNITNTTYEELRVSFTPTTNGVYYFGVNVKANGNPWYLSFDDLSIDLSPTCPAPTVLTASNITDVAADLGWTENGGATAWEIQYGAAGFSAGTGTIMAASANPTNVSGLTAETDYEFWVRAVCGAGDTSAWAGPFAFTTQCAVVTPDYVYNFDSTAWEMNCWSEAGNGTIATGPSLLGGSDWNSAGFLNDGTSMGGAKINLYSDDDQEWLISPTFDLSGQDYDLIVAAGLTNWNTAAIDSMGSDDEVHVLVTEDAGVTWTSIYVWDVNNQPSNSGDTITLSLSAYTGNAQFAIYATDGATDDDNDYDFHIGHFEIMQSSSVGIEENNVNAFALYPNPNNGQFFIKSENNIANATITVLDLQGKVVLTETANLNAGAQRQLVVNNVEAGMYILQVRSANGVYNQSLIIK